MSDMSLDALWVEKYRPGKIEDIVLPDDQREFFKRCIEKGEIPHMLFIGPPGSGKTTTARVICDILIKNNMDLFCLNGSDSTGVDVVRNEIQEFLKSPPYISRHKIVFIDEFDFLSINAQSALRNIMEKYADNGRFLCTGNYLSKISEPIQSRFQTFEMKSIKEEFAVDYCKKILSSENVEFDVDTVKLIIQNYMPDVRKAVGVIQKNVIDGKLKKIDVNSIVTNEKKISACIAHICDDFGTDKRDKTINQTIPEILKLVSQDDPDYRSIYQILSFHDGLPLWAKIKVNQYSNAHQGCALPSAHFMAMVFDIITAGMSYYTMFSKK